MSDDLFDTLATADRDEAFRLAAEALEAESRIDDLFDLHMLKAKLDHGVPADRPAAMSDVPDDKRRDVEVAYRDAARGAAAAFIERGEIAAAWTYLQAIREPGPVRDALDKLTIKEDYDEQQTELAHIALYEQAHPRRGVEMMLATNGMCNTVTAVDQVLPSLAPEDREAVAITMV